MTTQRPDWQQREVPIFQITDYWKGTYNDAMAVYAQANTAETAPFLEWVNEDRAPLHAFLRTHQSVAKNRLAERGIRLREVNKAVATLVGGPPYPLRRILPADVADILPVLKKALTTVTPGFDLLEENEINAQYNPLLSLVLLDGRYTKEADHTSLVETVASALGHAALGTIVDVSLSPDEPAFAYGYGYQWRQSGEVYGGMLQKAAARKIAAQVRKQLGITAAGKPEDDPLLEPYRKPEGYYYEDGMAITLDLISQSAGMRPNTPGIFEYVWEFAKSGRHTAPREELASLIKRTTDNKLTLEDLETAPVAFGGMPLTLLSKVEEACKIEASKRPSSLFKKRGVVSSD